MKVFLCLHHFLPDFIGGTEIYTLNLAKQLQKRGIEPVVLVPYFDHNENREYFYEDIRVIQYAEASIEDRQMILGKKPPDGLVAFLQLLKVEKPDIVHFHELAPGRGFNRFHVEMVYKYRIPIILTFHLSYYTCMKGSLVYRDKNGCDGMIRPGRCTNCIYHSKSIRGLNAKLLYSAAMALYAIGADPTKLDSSLGTALGFPFIIRKLKNDLLQLAAMANKIVVLAEWYRNVLISNGVPQQKLLNLQQALSVDSVLPHKGELEICMPLKVVYLGRLSEQKGLHLLIDAVCALSQEQITLDIYGPETDAAYVAENREKTQSRTNVHWKGRLGSTEIIETLSQYHVFCMPSQFEMSPLVIQEAFAAGLPVLASDIIGNREQVKNGVNGWLFRSDDVKDLTEKLNILSQEKTLIENARKNLPVPADFGIVTEQYIQVYSSVWGNPNLQSKDAESLKSIRIENQDKQSAF